MKLIQQIVSITLMGLNVQEVAQQTLSKDPKFTLRHYEPLPNSFTVYHRH